MGLGVSGLDLARLRRRTDFAAPGGNFKKKLADSGKKAAQVVRSADLT